MDDAPLTLQIVRRIAELLAQVTVANGWRTNIGQHVDTEPVQLEDDQALGAVVYLGAIRPGDKTTTSQPERVLEVVVDAYIGVALDDAQALQHAVYDDVERCFTGLKLSVPGALPLTVGAANFIPRTDDMATAGVQIVISATYRPKAVRTNP